MGPVIRVDDEVYKWLQQQAKPFEDTPNTVLRRIAQLDKKAETNKAQVPTKPMSPGKHTVRSERTARGWDLAKREALSVNEAFYHQEGTWYQPITKYPVALFDRYGYIVFQSKLDLDSEARVRVTDKTNVPNGIAALPGYKRMSRPAF